MEEVIITLNVIACTLLLHFQQAYCLIDLSATHFFVARKIKGKLKVQLIKLEKRFKISTPLEDVMLMGYMYKCTRITIKEYNMKVNLLPLELHDFDLIQGMDWLSTYMA